MKKWTLILERLSENKLNRDITKRTLRKIASAAERNRSLGFEVKLGRLEEPALIFNEDGKELHRYAVRLQLIKPRVISEDTLEDKFQHVLGVIRKCAQSKSWDVKFGETAVRLSNERESIIESGAEETTFRPVFTLPELDLGQFFGIYEREDQLRELYDAIRTHIETKGELANHTILYGQPGSCKTVMCERLKDWFNGAGSPQGYEWVRFIDGTTVTKAGAENWFKSLAESKDVPVVLVLDEIEKQEKTWLLGLLSIMGSGIITKLNAYTGNYREAFTPYIIGICNDEVSLKEFKNESLWSRFTHELYCPRPTRELALKILQDLSAKIPGCQPEWAVKALEFGWDELGQRDIRKIKGHLDGRSRLLNDSYQNAKRRMLAIEKTEKQAIQKERLAV